MKSTAWHESRSFDGAKKILLRRFGKELTVTRRRPSPEGGHDYQLTYNGKTKWVNSRTLWNRGRIQNLFLSSKDVRKKQYRKLKQEGLGRRQLAVRNKLEKLGVTDLTFLKEVNRRGKPYYVFHFGLDKVVVPVLAYGFNYEVKSAKDLYRRVFAYVRYKSFIPLAYTDREWRLKVESSSGGLVTSDRYVPPAYGKQTLRCLTCSYTWSPNTIFNKKNAVLRCPKCSTSKTRRYSKQAIVWLDDLAKRLKIKIKHGESETGESFIEFKGGRIYVDGMYKNIVFEYHGSRWHGNPLQFYWNEKPSPYSKDTALSLLKKTLQKEQKITAAGFNYVRIWDQDFLSEERYSQWLLKNLPRLKVFLSQS